MADLAVMVLRLVQFLAAAILLGSSLSFLSAPALSRLVPGRALLAAGAGAMVLGAAGGLMAQVAVMAGSSASALDGQALGMVVTGMDLGKAAVVRIACGLVALVAAWRKAEAQRGWVIPALCGGIAALSFAWSGHGAATEGGGHLVHLASDGIHALAGTSWVGFLVVFAFGVRRAGGSAGDTASLHDALRRFSGIGTGLVAALLLTGVVNGWFVIGPEHVLSLGSSAYGRLLLLKLALFAVMLGLAAGNRFRHVPRLGAGSAGSLAALRRSVLLETAAGAAVMACVAVFGALPPPSAL